MGNITQLAGCGFVHSVSKNIAAMGEGHAYYRRHRGRTFEHWMNVAGSEAVYWGNDAACGNEMRDLSAAQQAKE